MFQQTAFETANSGSGFHLMRVLSKRHEPHKQSCRLTRANIRPPNRKRKRCFQDIIEN